MLSFRVLGLGCALLVTRAAADCLANQELNDFFEDVDGRPSSIPRYGSCCMYDVCGLECPVPQPQPPKGTTDETFGIDIGEIQSYSLLRQVTESL